jgi:hypothetical protein
VVERSADASAPPAASDDIASVLGEILGEEEEGEEEDADAGNPGGATTSGGVDDDVNVVVTLYNSGTGGAMRHPQASDAFGHGVGGKVKVVPGAARAIGVSPKLVAPVAAVGRGSPAEPRVIYVDSGSGNVPDGAVGHDVGAGRPDTFDGAKRRRGDVAMSPQQVRFNEDVLRVVRTRQRPFLASLLPAMFPVLLGKEWAMPPGISRLKDALQAVPGIAVSLRNTTMFVGLAEDMH